jgi:uncharacterized coiled-coil protein SlyX
MNHAFKLCVIATCVALGFGNRAPAQCFACSDAYGNTAVGTSALNANAGGINNTVSGYQALYSNTTGRGNAAQGVYALYSNTTGMRNLAIGNNALFDNASGSYNVALGFNAGSQATGNDNIYINNIGVSGESQTLRLGAQGTAGVAGSGILSAYIAGVATSQVTGSAVYVTSSGQLGVLASSERFKTNVQAMHDDSDKLARLRPVTFKLKTDPNGTVQYGLIAEEVAKVYPELVIHGADGRIDGVRYEELAPILLFEVQQQQGRLHAQQAAVQTLSEQNKILAAQVHDLKRHQEQLTAQAERFRDLQQQMAEMRATLIKLQAKDELVARR